MLVGWHVDWLASEHAGGLSGQWVGKWTVWSVGGQMNWQATTPIDYHQLETSLRVADLKFDQVRSTIQSYLNILNAAETDPNEIDQTLAEISQYEDETQDKLNVLSNIVNQHKSNANNTMSGPREYQVAKVLVRLGSSTSPIQTVVVDKLPSDLQVTGLARTARYLRRNRMRLADYKINSDCLTDVEIYHEANRELFGANMPLQSWASNNKSLNQIIEKEFSGYRVPNQLKGSGRGMEHSYRRDECQISTNQQFKPFHEKITLVSETDPNEIDQTLAEISQYEDETQDKLNVLSNIVNQHKSNANNTMSQSSNQLPELNLINRKSRVNTRGLFDQRSQKTFITQQLVEQLKLKPAKSVKLNISGFLTNSGPREYQVAKVLVRLGSSTSPIQTVVVDKLPSDLQVTGLARTARYLRRNRMRLADYKINSDCLTDVEIYHEANRELFGANMPLQSWASNNKSLNQIIEKEFSGYRVPNQLKGSGRGMEHSYRRDECQISTNQQFKPFHEKITLVSETDPNEIDQTLAEISQYEDETQDKLNVLSNIVNQHKSNANNTMSQSSNQLPEGTTNDTSKLVEIYHEANRELFGVNMSLQSWASNNKSLNQIIEKEFSGYRVLNQLKVLGVEWNTVTDEMNVKSVQTNNSTLSLRKLLSLINKSDNLSKATPIDYHQLETSLRVAGLKFDQVRSTIQSYLNILNAAETDPNEIDQTLAEISQYEDETQDKLNVLSNIAINYTIIPSRESMSLQNFKT
ncbi:uncharacterized protein [Procambarus clarkii]|uniref:uncharacterized protein n=1 Tax=Procambarus clarkii TaxID=6728 RepID=UPI00374329B5